MSKSSEAGKCSLSTCWAWKQVTPGFPMSRDVPFLVVLQTNCSINWASPYLQAFALPETLLGRETIINIQIYATGWHFFCLLLLLLPLLLSARSGACPFAFPCKCARGARANEEPSSSSPVAPFRDREVIQRTCNRYL